MKLTELFLESLLSPDASSTSERHKNAGEYETAENAPAGRPTIIETENRLKLRGAAHQVDGNAKAHQEGCVDDTAPLIARGALPAQKLLIVFLVFLSDTVV